MFYGFLINLRLIPIHFLGNTILVFDNKSSTRNVRIWVFTGRETSNVVPCYVVPYLPFYQDIVNLIFKWGSGCGYSSNLGQSILL